MLRYLGCAVLGAPIVMLAAVASAQVAPQAAPVVAAPVIASPATTSDQALSQVGVDPAALSLDELSNQNGHQGVYIYTNATQALTATNSGNSITADHVGSGDISLTAGAFAGFAGIGNFVINSGHNNNLQGSLSILIVTP